MSLAKQKIIIKKKSSKPYPILKWDETGTCSHSITHTNPKTKCRMFDFDNCLVSTFTSTAMHNVIDTLRLIASDIHTCIVIISNQMGISKGKTTHSDVRKRFQEFSDILNKDLDKFIYLNICYSTVNDVYRKPHTGMFTLYLDIMKDHHNDITYCGDAAGRLKTRSRKKDFSNSDLLFAINCKIPFFVPEQVFSSESVLLPQTKQVSWPNFVAMPDAPKSPTPMVVILVGPQGIGKSAFAKKWAEDTGMVIVSQDILKKKEKVYAEFVKEIKKKGTRGVIIDNTNRDYASRRKFIDVAKSINCETVCVWWDVPKPLSFHMCDVRVELGGKSMAAPAIHIYYKNLEVPNPTNYDEFYCFKGVVEPSNEKFKEAFNMRFS